MIRKLATSIALSSALSLFAEEDQPKLETQVVELEEVTVTGERAELDEDVYRTEYPYHVSILEIDPKKIQNTSLQELLQEQASLQIRSFGGRANYSTLSIRGSSASQVTVFIDGVEINRGDRQSVDLSTLDLNQFKRIEIYRSHAPAKFGTGAIGGVVNLISKESSQAKLGNLKLGVGSFGFFESKLNAYLRHHKTQHRIYASHEQAEGDFDYVDDNLTPDNPIDDVQRTRINNDYKSYRLGWFAQKEWNPQNHLNWNLTYFDRDKGLPGPAKFQAADVRYLEEHISAQINYELLDLFQDNDSTNFSFSLQHFQDQYLDRNSQLGLGQQDFEYPTQAKTLGLRHSILSYPLNHAINIQYKKERQQSIDNLQNRYFQINKRDKLDLGYDLDYFLFNDRLEVSASTSASFIEDRLNVNNSSDSIDRDVWTWGLGLRYQVFSSLALKTSISKGLRIPTFSELFGDRGSTIGNNALVPEKSTNYDIGFEWQKEELAFLKAPSLEASLFRSDRDELIQMIFDSRGIGQPFNIGDGTIEGIEIITSTNFKHGFSFTQNYTYMRPTISKSNLANGQDKQIPNIYKKAWSPKISWSRNKFNCSYSVLIEQDKFYDTANLLTAKDKELHNINLAYQLKKVHLALDLLNLSDEQYEDFNNWPLAGRSIIFSIFTQH